MKNGLLSTILWVLFVVFTINNARAQPFILFLSDIDVASGNYYLIYQGHSYSERILYDDPAVLARYQDEILVRPEAGGNYSTNYLVLYRKDGSEIKQSNKGDLIIIPKAIRNLGKPLIREEIYYSEETYKARIAQLKTVPGITSVDQSSDNKLSYDFSIPNADNLITIRFPLMVVRTDSSFNPTEQLDRLEQRLKNELQQLDITDMGIDHKQVLSINHGLLDRIILHHDYQPLLVRHPRIIDDDKLALMNHQAYIFIIQLHCVRDCSNKIDKLNPLTWLESEIPHNDVIQQVRTIARKEKPWANRWRFNRDKLFSEASNDEDLGLGYKIIENNQQLSGFIRHEPHRLKLRWQFDLESALQGDLPEALLNPYSN